MSQLKKKPPPPPPKPANRPDIQAGPISEFMNGHLNGYADSKPPLGAALPPRRYTDVSRPRVLSPEPETVHRNALRSTNFQSRTFFGPSVANDAVSYRTRGGFFGNAGMDVESFASVRRKKSEEMPTRYGDAAYANGVS